MSSILNFVMSPITRASVLQGLQVMTVNPLRTALSTLGVVIGTASVIATLALADGLERYAREQIATQTDAQSISVSSKTADIRDGFSYPVKGYPIFTTGDAQELQRVLGAAGEVTMRTGGQAVVASASAARKIVNITATLANYLQFSRKDVAAGRFFTDGEAFRNAPVIVLSHLLARQLSQNGDVASMVGQVVRLDGRTFTTLGVMPAYTGERSYQAFIPLRAAATVWGRREIITPALAVRAPAIELVDATKEVVVEWLATRYRHWSDHVSVETSLAQLAQASAGMLIFKLIMGCLAGISLVVGGVGIMNVLLASVAERTREIGVRKAMGARQRDILCQFLAESVAIAGIGAAIGTALGLLASFTLAALVRARVPGAPMYAAVTVGTLLTAVISAVTIGLTFGAFPALRAARLSPIDAMRND